MEIVSFDQLHVGSGAEAEHLCLAAKAISVAPTQCACGWRRAVDPFESATR